MANTWWIVVPNTSDAERNAAATPKDAIIAEVSDTSGQYNTWLNTDNGGASYHGKTYYRRMGPFTSLKDAQDAYKTGATPASTPIPGLKINPDGSYSLSNPLSGLQAIAKVMADIGSALTNGKMWRSLGWLMLGLVLVYLGVRMWYGGSLGQAGVSAAKKVPGLPGKIAKAI